MGNGQPPEAPGQGVPSPDVERDNAQAKAKDILSDRSRGVAAGVLAVVWGLLVTETKLSVQIPHPYKAALAAAAILSLVALLFDFLQYLLEYLDAKWDSGRFLGLGGRIMFRSKQAMAFFAAMTLVLTVVALFLRESNSEASQVWHVYVGALWAKPDGSDQRRSTLLLSNPNPASGFVSGSQDRTPCEGVLNDTNLVLICPPSRDASATEHIRFNGKFENNKMFEGEWQATSLSTRRGGFSYRYSKDWTR
jgi:hypothetical protein